MDKELEKYYLENYKFVDLSACWFVIESDDGLPFSSTKKRQISIPVQFFKMNRKKFYQDPTCLMEEYNRQRPLDMIDEDFKSKSFYKEYLEFKDNYPNYKEHVNMHFTTAYYSEFNELNYISKIKFTVNLSRHNKITNLHLGKIDTGRDIMAKLIFDDVEYLEKNLNESFIRKVYLNFLQA